ncbi:MAG: 2-dehydropantoate 2-reductase [Candidatus Lokiarchaeota archaeon]|nr:2-dehydropantoate 2-reductase [Candidatus Lokiarchaeota archaeon]
MINNNSEIIIYGAGAVGTSIAGWLYPYNNDISLTARGKHAKQMKENGLTIFQDSSKNKTETFPINIINDISEKEKVDLVIISVKNYDLENAAKDISSKLGDIPVLALQNGVINQQILPKYFSKVIYSVLCFNSYIDAPGITCYQSKGPVYIGSLNNEHQDLLTMTSQLFNQGFKTIITDKIQDAIHCKLALNTINSIMALIGKGMKKFDELGSMSKVGKVVANMMLEATQIIKAAGYKEHELEGLPNWRMIKLGAKLPFFITKFVFTKKAKKMLIDSISQDIIMKQKKQSELETLNGYLLELADKLGLKVPYNKTVYELCKKQFGLEQFEPLSIEYIWNEIKKNNLK